MSSEVIPKGWLQVNIIFRVENFSKLKVVATSELHYLQDHEGKLFRNLGWQILVTPRQTEYTELDNPALVFFVQSCNFGEAPESERCEAAAIILRIINHKDPSKTYQRRFPSGISFGGQSGPVIIGGDYINPHSWKEISDPDLGFIKDGAVTFEANIRVHEDLIANIPNPGRLYLRDPNVPKAKKKKTSKKVTARKMQQRKTYKKSMLKAAEDGFQRIVENLVLEAGVDVNTMVPII